MNQALKREIVFGGLMSIFMVYGMEVYNACLRATEIKADVFLIPWGEMLELVAIVFVIQSLIGVPMAKKLTMYLFDNAQLSQFGFLMLMSGFTVLLMCPIMSMVATLMFKHYQEHLIQTWWMTFLANLPMAVCWQFIVAGPCVRKTAGWILRPRTLQAVKS